jgi:hypothetical protein
MSSRALSTLDALVPPASLASLLIAARAQHSRSLDDIEIASGGRFTVSDLRQIEAGVITLGDSALRAIARLYRIDLSTITPGRSQLVIDRSEGKILIGDSTGKFMPDDDDQKILLRYLSIVYKLRDTKPGVELGPRDADLEVLATVFGCSTVAVRDELVRLMRTATPELRGMYGSLRWRVAVPALGVLVAITAVGALILSRHSDEASAAGLSQAVSHSQVHIGNALVLEREPVASRAAGPLTVNIGDPITIEKK